MTAKCTGHTMQEIVSLLRVAETFVPQDEYHLNACLLLERQGTIQHIANETYVYEGQEYDLPVYALIRSQRANCSSDFNAGS